MSFTSGWDHAILACMNIEDLTYQELLDLNQKVVERLKLIDNIRTHAEMMQFSVGEKVQFSARRGERIRGVLAKYNKKTVTVVTQEGEHWNISPHVLTKVKQDPIDITNSVTDISESRPA
jgi:hypothetical protein